MNYGSGTKCTHEVSVGYAIVVIMNTVQTLLVDLVPNQSSSVTACVCVHATMCHRMLTLLLIYPEQSCSMLIRCRMCIRDRPHHQRYRRRMDICSPRRIVYHCGTDYMDSHAYGTEMEGAAEGGTGCCLVVSSPSTSQFHLGSGCVV